MRAFFRRRIVEPLLALLKQGLSPERLALSVGFGIMIGIFPMLGSTTFLCILVGFALGLNQPALQIVNHSMYPLQLAGTEAGPGSSWFSYDRISKNFP